MNIPKSRMLNNSGKDPPECIGVSDPNRCTQTWKRRVIFIRKSTTNKLIAAVHIKRTKVDSPGPFLQNSNGIVSERAFPVDERSGDRPQNSAGRPRTQTEPAGPDHEGRGQWPPSHFCLQRASHPQVGSLPIFFHLCIHSFERLPIFLVPNFGRSLFQLSKF